jgi:hypothetical protein
VTGEAPAPHPAEAARVAPAALGRARPTSPGVLGRQPRKYTAVRYGSWLALWFLGMKAIATLGAVGLLLLLLAVAVDAQPGVGVETTAPPPEQLELRPPPPDRTPPKPRGESPGGPHTQYTPVFIGPTLRSETTEFGFSGWIAPNPPVGSPRAAGTDVNGWGSVGLTFTWGGPPHRPASSSAIR